MSITMTDHKEHLRVCLKGGGPWGFRLQGGAGTGLPLVVSKVRRKSKAYKSLFEGDVIVSVNGRPCENLTYDQVMEIADKSGTDLTLEITRQECNKENLAPIHSTSTEPAVKTFPPSKMVENGAITKEVVSVTETTSKVIEEKEGMRIKSATLLPENTSLPADILDTFTSHKLTEEPSKQVAQETAECFPSFADLLQTPAGPPKPPRSPIDTSTLSKTEEFSGDENSFVRTSTETKHEVKGNSETSFSKTEQESVSKSIGDMNGVPGITLDTIDLNNLISATQKKLDSFKNGLKLDNANSDVSSKIYEERKTEIKTSTIVSESKRVETLNSLSHTPFTCDNRDSALTQDFTLPRDSDSTLTKNFTLTQDFTLPKDSTLAKDSTVTNDFTLADDSTSTIGSTLIKTVVNSTQDLDEIGGDPGLTTNSSESSYVTTETPFGSTTTIMKKKKMFSSSSFYEEPHSIYPTMEEQVEMARKIADSLADDTNKKSKGANMFYKRVKRSTKWIHEGPEPSDESAPGSPEVQGVEPPTPDPSQVPFRPSRGPAKLKLVLDPRHPQDATALRSSGFIINEHNVVSPDLCHGLVKDLHSPVGKGAALFAKRKKKSEEWVVDEEKVKNLVREQAERKLSALSNPPSALYQYSGFGRPEVKLVKTPWEAAMESPYGLCDSAFARINPDHLADTVIKAADIKRRNSITSNGREPSRLDGCISPPVPTTPSAAYYDIYHAKAPKGWASMTPTVNPTLSAPPVPSFTNTLPRGSSHLQSEEPSTKKMVFQNFNTVPRLWKGTSAL